MKLLTIIIYVVLLLSFTPSLVHANELYQKVNVSTYDDVFANVKFVGWQCQDADCLSVYDTKPVYIYTETAWSCVSSYWNDLNQLHTCLSPYEIADGIISTDQLYVIGYREVQRTDTQYATYFFASTYRGDGGIATRNCNATGEIACVFSQQDIQVTRHDTAIASIQNVVVENSVDVLKPLEISVDADLEADVCSAFRKRDIYYPPEDDYIDYSVETELWIDIYKNQSGLLLFQEQQKNAMNITADTCAEGVTFTYTPDTVDYYVFNFTSHITDDQIIDKSRVDYDQVETMAVDLSDKTCNANMQSVNLTDDPSGQKTTETFQITNKEVPYIGLEYYSGHWLLPNPVDNINTTIAVTIEDFSGTAVYSDNFNLPVVAGLTGTVINTSQTFSTGDYTVKVIASPNNASLCAGVPNFVNTTYTGSMSVVALQYNVTFTVRSSATVLEGALIEFASQALSTNSIGQAAFYNVDEGTYDYTVSLAGYVDSVGTVTVDSNRQITVTLGIANTPPWINLPDSPVDVETKGYAIDLTAYSGDSTNLTSDLIYALDSANDTVNVTIANGVATINSSSEKSVRFNFTVSDGEYTAWDTFDINFYANQSPAITGRYPSSGFTLYVGDSQVLNVTASEPGGDTLSYSWYFDGSPVGANNPEYNFTALAGHVGSSHTISVDVTDGLLVVYESWNVQVLNLPTIFTPLFNLTALAINDSAVWMRWIAPDGNITNYSVFRTLVSRDYNNFNNPMAEVSNTTNVYIDRSLSSSTQYFYVVRVNFNNGTNITSNEADATTLLAGDDGDADNDGLPDSWEDEFCPGGDCDPDEDIDNDGLTNLEEYENGTNPTVSDTDGDGMSDGWEVDNGLNPLDPNDANLDNDNDGLTNLEEYLAGTDPNNPDTDGDGFLDGNDNCPLTQGTDNGCPPVPDTTPPMITIISPQNTTYASNYVNLQVTANEPVDTWMYSLNGGANISFIPNITISLFSNGFYTIFVYANDSSGNIDVENVSFAINVISPQGGAGGSGRGSGGGGGRAAAKVYLVNYSDELALFSDPEYIINLINSDPLLQEAIKRAYDLGELTKEDIRAIAEETAKSAGQFSITRAYKYENGQAKLILRIEYNGNENLYNVIIYDTVPKGFADSSDKMTVETNGAVMYIMKNDPVYAFKFSQLAPRDAREISYTVNYFVSGNILGETGAPVLLVRQSGEKEVPVSEETTDETEEAAEDEIREEEPLAAPTGFFLGAIATCDWKILLLTLTLLGLALRYKSRILAVLGILSLLNCWSLNWAYVILAVSVITAYKDREYIRYKLGVSDVEKDSEAEKYLKEKCDKPKAKFRIFLEKIRSKRKGTFTFSKGTFIPGQEEVSAEKKLYTNKEYRDWIE